MTFQEGDGTNIQAGISSAQNSHQITCANNATILPFGNNNVGGLVEIKIQDTGDYGLFLVQNPVVLVAQSGSIFSATSGTASKVNVYLDSGNSFYPTIQNKSGSSHNIRTACIYRID